MAERNHLAGGKKAAHDVESHPMPSRVKKRSRKARTQRQVQLPEWTGQFFEAYRQLGNVEAATAVVGRHRTCATTTTGGARSSPSSGRKPRKGAEKTSEKPFRPDTTS